MSAPHRNGYPLTVEDDGQNLLRLEQAAVRRLQATRATVDRSYIGAAHASRITFTRSAAGVIAGRSVACDEVRTGILAAPIVRGDVHTWLDLRAAFMIGVGMALGHALLGLLRRTRG